MRLSSTSVITWGIRLTTVLFAAFGGFLTRIAPPDQTLASYPIGIVSFLVLIALLTIAAVRGPESNQADRKRWTIAGVVFLLAAIPAAILYPSALDRYTYWYPPEKPLERHVQATPSDLTDLARGFLRDHPSESSAGELERNLPSDKIWTGSSIDRANRILLLTYAWLVLALATAIFCLLEANAQGAKAKKAAQSPVPRRRAPAGSKAADKSAGA